MGNGRVSVLTALVFVLATVAVGNEIIQSKIVAKRIAVMQQANTALDALNGMTTGRLLFDEALAEQARTDLIDALNQTPRRFRRERTEALSHADPSIWANYKSFEEQAELAIKAARRIRTGSKERIENTLPPVIAACFSCHQKYRKTKDNLGRFAPRSR